MNSNSFRIKAPAKINLFLDITGKNDNGYHNLSSVMQSLDLFDYVTVTKNESDNITLKCNYESLNNDKNIAVKAARLFLNNYGKEFGIDILIDKNIPIEAGLAGGSSDAAAVLLGLNNLFDSYFSEKELLSMAALLGSDVPFMLKGSTILCSGTGNIFTEVSKIPQNCWVLLVKPELGVSTSSAYKYYDEHESNIIHNLSVDALLDGLNSENISDISNAMFNVFEQTISSDLVASIKDKALEFGALGSLMTGSGPTVFSIFDDEAKAVPAMDYFKCNNMFSVLTRPTEFGVTEDLSYKVENRLDSLNIKYSRINHPAVYTMEEMYALGIFSDGIVGKNLFVRDSKGKRHFLIFVYGDKKVCLSSVEELLDIKHISFGSAERLYSHLGLTKGSVSPLGVVNNSSGDVEFVIDRDFINCSKIGMHPNQNTSTLWLSFTDLIKVIESNGNTITYVDL